MKWKTAALAALLTIAASTGAMAYAGGKDAAEELQVHGHSG